MGPAENIPAKTEDKKPPAKHGPGENDGADKNFDFVQVSRSSLKQWRLLTMESQLASAVLMILIERMGKVNNAIICSYNTLTELTGYSRASVAKAIKKLKDDKWIATVKVGSATAYCINERVVWQSSRSARKFALFSATVIASATEQEAGTTEVTEVLKRIPVLSVERKESATVISDAESETPPDQQDLDF